ncbi:MAG: redox-sensing transcriptional repressor Rex [Rhodothermaceae bacterium]
MKRELISAPIPTLKRLPKYYHLLKKYSKTDKQYVSARMIADELKMDPILVRKDIQSTGIVGKPKIGFELKELMKSINTFLNWDNLNDAFLVGVGGLGQAILGYESFKNYGLNIVAAFDVNKEVIGRKIRGIEILPLDKLANLAKRMHINIGVMTVPPSAAQEVADQMVEGNIQAIWNFAPVDLKLPETIILENVLLSQSLGVLTHKLAQKINSI